MTPRTLIEPHTADDRLLAYWLQFEVQKDENELRLWNARRDRNSGVGWSGMSGGEKPVMRSDAERIAAAEAVIARQTQRVSA